MLSLQLLFCLGCSTDNDISVPDYFEQGLNDGVNYGLAAKHPGDDGIVNDPFVLAFENFESGEVLIPTEEDRYKNNVNVVSHNSFTGKYSGEHLWRQGFNGPTCRYVIPESAHNEERPAYFVRMYIKHTSSFHPYYGSVPPAEGDYASVGVKGFGIANESVSPSSEVPDGTNWYNVQCQFVGWGPSVKPEANDKYLWVGHLYSYNPDAGRAIPVIGDELRISNEKPNGNSTRFSAYADPFTYLEFDRWYCFEVGLYLNSPGKYDGEARFWIDGILQSRTTNICFRNEKDLYPMYVHLNLHRTTEQFPHNMIRYVDNIVIANRYIGPVAE